MKFETRRDSVLIVQQTACQRNFWLCIRILCCLFLLVFLIVILLLQAFL